MGFALLSPSYGTDLVGWAEQREAHQKPQAFRTRSLCRNSQ